MILYLDANALVKCYILESGTKEIRLLLDQADESATSVISKAEVTAGIAKAIREGKVDSVAADAALRKFYRDWSSLIQVEVLASTVDTASDAAWQHGLRGYDAVHFASVFQLQDAVLETAVFATFDKQLWSVGCRCGLTMWPQNLSA